MNTIAGLRPVHPGEILREDVIPASGLSKAAFARRIGISREALHNILSGSSAISTLVALKLGKLLGNSPQAWLNMQQAYDLAMVEKAKHDEIEKVETLEFA